MERPREIAPLHIAPEDYSELEPYGDHHVTPVLRELLGEATLMNLISSSMPAFTKERLSEICEKTQTIAQFQENIMIPAVDFLVSRTTEGVTASGLENLAADRCHLFISNHRDIALDSTFIARILHSHRGQTMQMAIGDNLIMAPWLTHLFKLNKTVIVQRNLTPRALLSSSKRLSSYIHHTVKSGKDSFWIAQAEGRCKDGNDLTQSGLVKMLTLAGGKNWEDAMQALDPVPVSLSYEWDPCDMMKAHELVIREQYGSYEKKPGEDLDSIVQGLRGRKGRVHVAVGKPLSLKWDELMAVEGRNARLSHLQKMLDDQIIGSYKLWPTHYIAEDLITGSDTLKDHYTVEEKAFFLGRLNKRLSGKENGEAIRQKLLESYANPLRNQKTRKD